MTSASDRSPQPRCSGGPGLWLAFGLYTLLVGWMFWPSLLCLTTCYLDLGAIHGRMGSFEFADTLLNSWILAWAQHGLSSQPLDLFEANTFYPANDSLAGSEHLLGLALLSWPLRLFSSNAIGIYQITLIGTFLVLALTSFAFVRQFTDSTWLALLSGACAIFMPWRMADLTHIQLLGAHWFPLIWLLALRITLNEPRRSDPVLLFCVLCLQLLTSFYLAYSISLSLALCMAMGMLAHAPNRRLLRRLVMPVLGAYGVFLLSAIPYLSRAESDPLVVTPGPSGLGLAELIGLYWSELVPVFQTGWSQAADATHSYSIPLAVALSALVSVWRLAPLRRPDRSQDLREWTAGWSLWLIVLASLCLMLGQEARIGDVSMSLPAGWAAAIVPGFENLRAPHRWAIPIALAAPLLAGIGLHGLQRWWTSASRGARGRPLAATVYGALLLLLVISVPWRQLPSENALMADPQRRAPYEKLASLPEGAVMELPWHTEGTYYVRADAQYMLASTIHWKKITNGFTAHLPRHFKFLRRIASRLPDPEALTTIRRLVDIRFLVVHLDALRNADRVRWREALAREADMKSVYDEHGTLILELARRSDTGIWQSSLLPGPERPHTLSGLSRETLETENGTLRVSGPQTIREPIAPDLGIPFSLRLENLGAGHWPGLDPDEEGLVMIRAAWVSEDLAVAGESFFPLDADLSPGVSYPFEARIPHPGQAGPYWVCFGLVQIRESVAVPLKVRSVTHRIEIIPRHGTDLPAESNVSSWNTGAAASERAGWCRDLVPDLKAGSRKGG